jgi:nucleotide-binding universal stress UspA family protein
MSKPVIAAVDPRREDVAPVALGTLLARLLGRPLLVASLYPLDLGIDNLIPDYSDALRRRAQDAADRVAASVTGAFGAGVEITTRAVAASGSPSAALHGLAEHEDASLLVLGSSHRGPAGRVMPSAVTDRLLHGAPCPVAVAPSGYSTADAARGLRSIAVAYTDTPDGHAALAAADALTGAAQAQQHVLVVTESVPALASGFLAGPDLDAARKALADEAGAATRSALAAISHAERADAEVLSGSVADALADASAGRDLLVCGSRGHGPVRTLVLGGVSHELVRKAACPVLVVPLGTLLTAARGAQPRAA